MKIKYANECVQKLGVGDPTISFYQFIYDERDIVDTKMTQLFLCMDWDHVSRYIVMWRIYSMHGHSVII